MATANRLSATFMLFFGMAELLYEGKAKKIFTTGKEDVLRQQFKDDATAFNGKKHEVIAGKAELNAKISTFLFAQLEKAGISTHFISFDGKRSQQVKALKMIPVEVVVRNRVAGSFAKRSGRKEGEKLPEALVEFFYKDDAGNDPQLSEEEVLKYCSEEERSFLISEALKINQILSRVFGVAGIDLVDFKIEFGKSSEDEILLGDEISPDCCRLWDQSTAKILDKDVFRKDLGDLIEAYEEVAKRLGLSN